MKYSLIIILILDVLFNIISGQDDVLYMKYFKDDFNFKANISMLSTDRRGRAHLSVGYNANDFPVKIEKVSSTGVIEKREMLKYDITGKLLERGEYTD